MTTSLDTLPYERPFYGTPRKFKSLATAYVTENHIKGDRKRVISFSIPRLLGNRNYDPKQDDEHVGIDFFYNGADGGAAECRIVVESQPTRPGFPPARLRVTMRAGEWALLRDVVVPFLDHLRAEDFLGEDGQDQPTTPAAAQLEPAATKPATARRGRKSIPPEQAREIVQFYLANQGTMNYEAVGSRFGVSAKTVQRYVTKSKMS